MMFCSTFYHGVVLLEFKSKFSRQKTLVSKCGRYYLKFDLLRFGHYLQDRSGKILSNVFICNPRWPRRNKIEEIHYCSRFIQFFYSPSMTSSTQQYFYNILLLKLCYFTKQPERLPIIINPYYYITMKWGSNDILAAPARVFPTLYTSWVVMGRVATSYYYLHFLLGKWIFARVPISTTNSWNYGLNFYITLPIFPKSF